MAQFQRTEFLLIRHAPARNEGRLAGRRDVPADLPPEIAFQTMRKRVGEAQLLCSPALRCRQTAKALWPKRMIGEDSRLWEQDFGLWEGMAFEELPDLGVLTAEALARHRPPQGESFSDLCARVSPVFRELSCVGGRHAIVAHAGVVRAALALALGTQPPALSFHIAPFSLSVLVALPDGGWMIDHVNMTFP